LATALVIGGAGVARAQTNQDSPGRNVVIQYTADGECDAQVYNSLLEGPHFAQALVQNDNSGYTCTGWLERSADGGESWSTISGDHTVLNNGAIQDTDPYYDGPGYEARACFKFTSWAGAATHCTDPLTV
jgi:hypothetical protein